MTTQLSLGFETAGQSDIWQPAPDDLSLPFEVDAHREPLVAQLVDLIPQDKASPEGVTATPTKLIDLTHYASRLGYTIEVHLIEKQ